jgi:SprA-related family
MDAVRPVAAAGPQDLRPLGSASSASGAAGAADSTAAAQTSQAAGFGPAVTTGSARTAQGLSASDQRILLDLQQIDARVRAHEAAHAAAGGALAGGASFQTVIGPDGRTYAVGGEVPIRIATGRTPQETIALAEQVLRAALAPADPSGQDLAVAAEAESLIATAQAQAAADQALLAQVAGTGQGAAAGAPTGQATGQPVQSAPARQAAAESTPIRLPGQTAEAAKAFAAYLRGPSQAQGSFSAVA